MDEIKKPEEQVNASAELPQAELDKVVGGTDNAPAGTTKAPTTDFPTESVSFNYGTIKWT